MIQFFTLIKYATSYLAPFNRKLKILSVLEVLLSPFQTYRDRLTSTTYPMLERAARFNAQVTKFEVILNEIFNSGTDIYIDESGVRRRIYLHRTVDNDPLFLHKTADGNPTYLGTAASYLPTFDFTVNVPQALYNSSLAKIKAYVEKYKLVGTTYSIRPY